MMPFFNRNWAGACRGRWAGPGLLAGWAAGSWIVWVEVGSRQCWSAGSGRGTSLQRAVTCLASGAISMCLLGAGLVRA